MTRIDALMGQPAASSESVPPATPTPIAVPASPPDWASPSTPDGITFVPGAAAVTAAVPGLPAAVVGSPAAVTGLPAAVTGSPAEVTGSPAAEVTGSHDDADDTVSDAAAVEVSRLGANLIARIEANRAAAQARRAQRTLLREISAASVEPPTVDGGGDIGDIAVAAAPMDTQHDSLTTEDDASAAALAAAADAMSMLQRLRGFQFPGLGPILLLVW